MVKLFNADGTVKQEWSGALHAAPVMRQGKLLTQIYGSNSVLAEIELAEGEQVGAEFTSPKPQVTQASPTEVAAGPQALTVQEIAERLEHAGLPTPEANAIAKLHSDVNNIINGVADSLTMSFGAGLAASTPAAETAIGATPASATTETQPQ